MRFFSIAVFCTAAFLASSAQAGGPSRPVAAAPEVNRVNEEISRNHAEPGRVAETIKVNNGQAVNMATFINTPGQTNKNRGQSTPAENRAAKDSTKQAQRENSAAANEAKAKTRAAEEAKYQAELAKAPQGLKKSIVTKHKLTERLKELENLLRVYTDKISQFQKKRFNANVILPDSLKANTVKSLSAIDITRANLIHVSRSKEKELMTVEFDNKIAGFEKPDTTTLGVQEVRIQHSLYNMESVRSQVPQKDYLIVYDRATQTYYPVADSMAEIVKTKSFRYNDEFINKFEVQPERVPYEKLAPIIVEATRALAGNANDVYNAATYLAYKRFGECETERDLKTSELKKTIKQIEDFKAAQPTGAPIHRGRPPTSDGEMEINSASSAEDFDGEMQLNSAGSYSSSARRAQAASRLSRRSVRVVVEVSLPVRSPTVPSTDFSPSSLPSLVSEDFPSEPVELNSASNEETGEFSTEGETAEFSSSEEINEFALNSAGEGEFDGQTEEFDGEQQTFEAETEFDGF